MWIKKTEKELMIKENNKFLQYLIKGNWDNKPLKSSLLISIFTFILNLLLELIFGVPTHGRYTPGPPDNYRIGLKDIPDRLSYYFIISFIVGLLAFILLIFSKKKNRSIDQDLKKLDFVCDKCNKLKSDDGLYNCECGGTFFHIDKMKWID